MMKYHIMRLLSIHIENFRCYEDLFIDFSSNDKLTVIVAKNGDGKTSLLDVINIGLGTFVSKMPESKGQGFRTSDIRLSSNSEKQYIDTGMPKVTMQLLLNDRKCTVVRELANSHKKTFTTKKDASDLTSFASELLECCNEQEVETMLPIVAYYGDHRIFASDSLGVASVKPMLKRRRQYAYANSMKANSNYKEFIQWYIHTQLVIKDARIRQEDAIKSQKPWVISDIDGEINSLNLYCEKLYDVIEKVFADFGWNHLSYSLMDLCIFIERIDKTTGIVQEKIPISNLSAGTKAILGIITDLFYRCFTLNPQSYMFQEITTPGIVLIDEIDLHLHPSWQQQILPTLKKIFPNIQFIVTTHSPQVVSSVPKECVRVIANGEIVPFDTPTQGVETSDILAGIFGTDPIPQNLEIVQKLNKLHALLAEGKGNSDAWNLLFAELEHYYGNSYPPLLGALKHKEFLQKRKEQENA